jgi:hypothetical protein
MSPSPFDPCVLVAVRAFNQFGRHAPQYTLELIHAIRLSNDRFNVDELRTRLRAMPDEKLLQFGEAARCMCTPEANLGKPPLPVYVIQLEEMVAEWRRRHPKQ